MNFEQLISCFYYLLTSVTAFNLFPKHAHVFTTHNPRSYFGYSVLLRRGTHESQVIVGAPRSNSTFASLHGYIVEPGAVFTCSFSTNNCSQFLFDPNGNTLHRAPNGMSYYHKKDHGWLGGSIAGEDITGGLLVACAPRWINQNHKLSYYLQNGLCYLLKDTSNIEKTAEELIPLLYSGNQGFRIENEHVYYYALGEAGMATHLTKDKNEILIGAPGVLQWKGMVIKYVNTNSNPGDISQKSNLKNSNFEDFVAPNPFYVSNIEDFSYFGYAVSSGNFVRDSPNIWYVGGAPRGKSLFGQVLVYEYVKNKNELIIHYEMNGRQGGEYFGAALTVADVNNDKVDDIIVGSPMYATERHYDVGCAYVFLNNGEGVFSRSIIDGPQMTKIRFGTSVSNIGDINQDGYDDIAVGAPYYNDDRGAIFIYMGSEKGLEDSYSQRILAEDINPNLRGFGGSISKGVDIDSNYYPDVGVGAYASGHAVVIKTKPVVKITASMSFTNKRISINTKYFSISVCMTYDGVHVPSTLLINMNINADPLYKRVYFTENRGGMWNISKHFRQKQLECQDFNLTVSSIKSDFTQPIQFQMNYRLVDSTEEGRFCNTCPVLDERSVKTTYLSIPFQINCGDDNVCQPDLHLVANFIHDTSHFVLGSKKEIDISVAITNSGEPAFLSRIFVTIPEHVAFKIIPNVCQQSTDQILICSMGNPLSKTDTKSLILGLDVSSLSSKDRLEVKLNVTSVGNDVNLLDNVLNLQLPLKTEATLSLIGMSDPEQFTFVDKNEMFKQDNLTFYQQFSIQNLGPSPLNELQLDFLVPYKLRSRTENLLQIFKPEASLDDNSLTCTLLNKEDFYIDEVNDHPTSVGEFMKEESKTKRSAAHFQQKVSSDDAVKPEVFITPDSSIPAGLPLNRTLSLNCMAPDTDVYCFEIRCISGPMRRLQNPATIKFKLIVNLRLIDEIRGEKDIIVVSSSVHPVSEYIRMNATYAHMILLGSLRSESIMKWIILGCVLGLVLMCAIIFGLYKAGFFKRADREKLRNEKEDNFAEDTELNSTE